MSKKNRKARKKFRAPAKPKRTMSSQQTTRLQQAVHAQSAGNPGFAEAEYRALLAEKAGTPQLYCNLAQICAQSARNKEAFSLWKNALAIDPRFLEARMNLADSYQQAGNIERAISYYQQILTDHKSFVIAKYLLANLLKAQGKFKQAAEYYQQVMSQQADYTQAHFSYSGIHKYKAETDPHIGLMLDLVQKTDLTAENRIHLAFALFLAFNFQVVAHAQLDTGAVIRYDDLQHPVLGASGMVAAQNRLAAETGAQILADGGNAIDAAVATGFSLAVTLPRAGNLGGGGFMLIHDAANDENIAIDYREMAPQKATRDMYLDANGDVDTNRSRFSHLAAGVPGSVSGLYTAHKKFGRLPWKKLLQPAIRQAREGVHTGMA